MQFAPRALQLLQCDNSFSFIHLAHTRRHSLLLAQFFTLSGQLSSFFFVLSDVFWYFSIVLVNWCLVRSRLLSRLSTHHLCFFSSKDNHLGVNRPLITYVRARSPVKLCQIRRSQCELLFGSSRVIIICLVVNLLRGSCHGTSTSVVFAKSNLCRCFGIVARTVLRCEVFLT